jgi:hypothetical protein
MPLQRHSRSLSLSRAGRRDTRALAVETVRRQDHQATAAEAGDEITIDATMAGSATALHEPAVRRRGALRIDVDRTGIVEATATIATGTGQTTGRATVIAWIATETQPRAAEASTVRRVGANGTSAAVRRAARPEAKAPRTQRRGPTLRTRTGIGAGA